MHLLYGRFLSLALLSFSSVALSQTQENVTNAEKASDQLNTWYDSDQGLWTDNGKTYWWDSANCLTAQIHLALVDGNVVDAVTQQLETTYQNAPNYPAKRLRRRSSTIERRSDYEIRILEPRAGNGFLNNYYDDEGWWALTWIDAYDLTQDVKYLDLAIDIFLDMTKGWPSQCNHGGIVWRKDQDKVNAIENELFVAVAAALAIRDTNSTQAWTNWAQGGWEWFQKTGLINDQSLINDGLDDCKNTGKDPALSYNQGVILGGLTDLATVTNDKSYIDEANKLAAASMGYLTSKSNGKIVGETCCNADTDDMLEQFKGIYVRNLVKLYQKSPSDQMRQVLVESANGAWNNNGASGQLHNNWVTGAGGFNAVTQSSGLDALVALLMVNKQ
ncbi:MAG: hypothetical protein Q9162_004511 [Coniocarpon cinnabarinum]